MKYSLLCAAAAPLMLCSSIASAKPVGYDLVKDKSSLKFVAMQNSAPVTGQFTDFDADILFDFDRPQDGKIMAVVKIGSLTSSYDKAQEFALTKDWLSAEAFPEASFASTKISRIPGTESYYAEGELTLRGKTVPSTLNFQIERLGDTAIANGFLTVSRSKHGVGQGEWAKDDVVKDQVRAEFRIVAKQKVVQK